MKATKRYIRLPIPVEAWSNFKSKQDKINRDFFEITGKKRIIPLSTIVLRASRQPLSLDMGDIVGMSRRKKR